MLYVVGSPPSHVCQGCAPLHITHVFFCRYQSKLHLSVAAAAGPGDERLQAQGFLPLVPAGAEQPR